jgi:hypothetical protein
VKSKAYIGRTGTDVDYMKPRFYGMNSETVGHELS